MSPGNPCAPQSIAVGMLGAALLLLAPGCSSSSGSPAAPTIGAARTFQLAGFQPADPVRPGKTVDVAFTIDQPSGAPLVKYRTGSGPHTGVHLIVVRDDLSSIVHRHPKIAADGSIRQPLSFAAPGHYRVLVDAYPNLSGPRRNFQLFTDITVAGAYKPRPLPRFSPTQTVNGYRVTLQGASHLKAIQAAFVKATVTDPQGRPVKFVPFYGALAHAIFFRAHTLDYFHTHVCGAAANGCTSALGTPGVIGHSTRPGRLDIGILLPLPGTWRLFLQFQTANGGVVTAPFTLVLK
jgi:hypothetical protein